MGFGLVCVCVCGGGGVAITYTTVWVLRHGILPKYDSWKVFLKRLFWVLGINQIRSVGIVLTNKWRKLTSRLLLKSLRSASSTWEPPTKFKGTVYVISCYPEFALIVQIPSSSFFAEIMVKIYYVNNLCEMLINRFLISINKSKICAKEQLIFESIIIKQFQQF